MHCMTAKFRQVSKVKLSHLIWIIFLYILHKLTFFYRSGKHKVWLCWVWQPSGNCRVQYSNTQKQFVSNLNFIMYLTDKLQLHILRDADSIETCPCVVLVYYRNMQMHYANLPHCVTNLHSCLLSGISIFQILYLILASILLRFEYTTYRNCKEKSDGIISLQFDLCKFVDCLQSSIFP